MLMLRSAALPSLVALSLSVIAAALPFAGTARAESPAGEAVKDLQATKATSQDVVQNRFFLKANRFEIDPVIGYVPNNPFVKRYLGGVMVAYHLSEAFAAEGALFYSPDLGQNDLKGLTSTLVEIAHQGNQSSSFQQPIEKMTLGATFAGRWAPVYGKINVLGERVLNFDFYGTGGIGLLSIAEYYATYNDSAAEGESIVALSSPVNKYKVPVNIGIGFDFFLNQTIALKIDARNYLYVDQQPDYDPSDETVLGSRLYNTFIASVGIGIFVPKMKQRLTDF
jgi:outer membrane beta-barrel protein